MINRGRMLFMGSLGTLTAVVTVLWLLSRVAGVGIYWRHVTPAVPPSALARHTLLRLDFTAGQAWVDYASVASDRVRGNQPVSEWTMRFYQRGSWLLRADAIGSSCASGQLYIPAFAWTPMCARTNGPDFDYIKLSLPLYLACIVLVPAPLLAFIRGPWRRRKRRKRGLCLACGYNLTGNTSGNCPECGTTAINPGDPA